MKYLCLMYLEESVEPQIPREMIDAGIAACRAFFDWLAKSRHMIGHNILEKTRAAKTVRVRKGKMLITDGPFAETKEQLGGYFLIEADDLEQAIEVALKFPGAQWGCVEVRPIHEARTD